MCQYERKTSIINIHRHVNQMYRGCQTKVPNAAGESGSFNVDVGLHHGSALSSYLFLTDVLTEGVRKDLPESMMFADDVVLCGGREVDMTRPANRPAFGGTVPLFYQMSRVALNHGNVPLFVRSRICFRARNL